MQNLLQVRELKICYRSQASEPYQAVRGVSFDIRVGEVLGLMGESGCGKTTIALSLLGLLSRDCANVSGSIVFGGQDLLTLNESALRRIRGAQISLIYQEPEIALCPVMRVGQQVAEIIRAHKKMSASRCQVEAESLLARVGFPDSRMIASRYPHQLSGGQRQRVLLAQALSCAPALIIADEPTASLDSRSQGEFLALLRQVKDQTGTAMLLISHTPEVQASVADRLVVMAEGRIIEHGDVRHIFRQPCDTRTRKLLERNVAPRAHTASNPPATEHQLV
jgi:ABC-type glutathione transport system ATPase component